MKIQIIWWKQGQYIFNVYLHLSAFLRSKFLILNGLLVNLTPISINSFILNIFLQTHLIRNSSKKSIFRPIIFVNDVQSQIQILERVKAAQAQASNFWQHLSSLLLKARANLISKLLHRNILQARLSRKVYWNETFVKMWEIEKCRDVCFNQGPGRFIKEGPDQKPNLGSNTWPSLGGRTSAS